LLLTSKNVSADYYTASEEKSKSDLLIKEDDLRFFPFFPVPLLAFGRNVI